MIFRTYRDQDEQGWLRCRVVSFLDCSYFNDVKIKKEKYPHPSVDLVADDNGIIAGLLSAELDSGELIVKGGRGAIIWHMAVLPEHRNRGVATKLWETARRMMLAKGIRYCELWTQEDTAANGFYRSIGFSLEESQSWIRCYARGSECLSLLNSEAIGTIYRPEELVFGAPVSRKGELKEVFYRIDEVRLYRRRL